MTADLDVFGPGVDVGGPSWNEGGLSPFTIPQSNGNVGNGAGVGTGFYVARTRTFDRICVHIGASSGNIDVGLYRSDGASKAPSTKIVSSGSVACPTANTLASVTIAATTLTPGFYWAVAANDNATAGFGYTRAAAAWALQTIRCAIAATAFPLASTLAGVTLVSSADLYIIFPAKS